MATSTFFSDIPLNFIPNPVTGDIRPVTDEKAVKSSLINLMRTNLGDRPYRPNYGVDLERYLFQPADSFTELDLNDEIASAIKRNEPRVSLVAIETKLTDYDIEINVEYYVMNVPGVQNLNVSISRTK